MIIIIIIIIIIIRYHTSFSVVIYAVCFISKDYNLSSTDIGGRP
jgi:hypothetical protein